MEKQEITGIIKLPRPIHGDFPFNETVASAGEHDAYCNPQGAVWVIAENGKPLGLKPGEFDWVRKY